MQLTLMNNRLKKNNTNERRGLALVLVALSLPLIIGIVAFAVNIGMMALLRAEIQNAVDAGTLAAVLQFQDEPADADAAGEAALEFVQRNRVGSTLTIPEDAVQVEIGRWDADAETFTATTVDANAVHVFARQDDQESFFGKIFGRQSYGAPADGIASILSTTTDIMMVLDLSGSMFREGRIQALLAAAPIFVDVIESFGGRDQIGMMGLSADPNDYTGSNDNFYQSGLHEGYNHYHVGVLERTLTTDFDNLRNVTLSKGQLKPQKYGPGYTGTGGAMGDAVHYLVNGAEARAKAKKYIVLMSDGRANRPIREQFGPIYALMMAEYARQNDVTVYTISLGNGADLETMQRIADITGGEHFDATGSGVDVLTARLTEAFENVANSLRRPQLVQ